MSGQWWKAFKRKRLNTTSTVCSASSCSSGKRDYHLQALEILVYMFAVAVYLISVIKVLVQALKCRYTFYFCNGKYTFSSTMTICCWALCWSSGKRTALMLCSNESSTGATVNSKSNATHSAPKFFTRTVRIMNAASNLCLRIAQHYTYNFFVVTAAQPKTPGRHHVWLTSVF